MRKILPFFIVLCFLFPACGNEENPENAAKDANTTDAGMSENEAVLAIGANVYEELKDEQGNASYKYVKWLAEEEKVTLLSEEGKRTKVIDYDGVQREVPIAPVQLEDGKKYFLAMYYVLPQQKLGVAISKEGASVYTGLDGSNITTNTVPRATILGLALVDDKENTLNMLRFVAYAVPQSKGDPVNFGTWGTSFIKSSEVSMDENDVKMAKKLLSMDKKPVSLWAKMIEDAETQHPNSVFLEDARKKLAQVEAFSAEVAYESYSADAVVNDFDVNVRSMPRVMENNVIGLLAKLDRVRTTARTTEEYTVSGITAHWYKIQGENLEGWVFGQYLSIE